ncbi:OmpA family protein [Luteimonas huabeiensis]|uniref:OmpA family protein n=1 Tax=Luteimonas huabeiensis TaxID=1244513 RepID=UPI0004B248A5|nr:OmpA family protein [Luteimonas huabeiensis]
MRFKLTAAIAATIALLATGCASRPAEPPPPPEPPAAPLPSSFLEKLSADGLFAFGRASIDDFNPAGLAALDELAERLNARPLEIVHVIGHSDRIGNDRANLRLSEQRANAVRDYLIERGVPAGRITAVGRGSVEPVVDCEGQRGDALKDCLAPNRRVEVRIQFAD